MQIRKRASYTPAWLLGLGLLAVTSTVLAQQAVNETRETGEAPHVDIEHMNGKAVIKGWEQQQVRVVGELGKRTEEFIFTSEGNRVSIRVEVARKRNDWGFGGDSDGDDLTIYVPQKSRLSYNSINASVAISDVLNDTQIEVVNGDVDARGLAGRISLESVNGDIDIDGISGDLSIETVNGHIRGSHRAEGEGRFESVNGDIEISSDSPEMQVETVNGDIELALQNVNELDLNTVNGRVEAAMSLMDSGDVRASSVGGSIELSFQESVSARFDIEAHAGGRIINNISNEQMMKAKYGPRRWLEFSHNGGNARVEISTVSGRVTVNN
ncbi:hypothetical protein DXV75_10010 [Alteromonas aestuariivivens]|uniref:DUF4097 domain-containing protein n=2 Tax=Alteromonas aestuariivivens TaxID=1938339 RepID=A0A3D8M7D6_9ALTE|nr:hypothetical protein DXV75_10010 [Alteromonas aestuariivivens]